MRFTRFSLPTIFICSCLAACGKKDAQEPAAPLHPAQRYADRIAASHRWTGAERDYEPGVRDIRTQLPDTTFEVRFSNDTTVRVGAVELPYYKRGFVQPDDSTVWFYLYEKTSGKNHFLIYYPCGDSLQYEERVLSIYGMYNRVYTAK